VPNPPLGPIVGTTYLVLQIGLMCQALAAYYTIDVNEQWRDSAALVLARPAVPRARFMSMVMRPLPLFHTIRQAKAATDRNSPGSGSGSRQ